MKKTEILNFNSFAGFWELVNVNTITVAPLPFLAMGTEVIVKHQLQKLNYVETATVLDDATLVGSFTIDSTGTLVFIVDKTIVQSSCQAQEYIVGFIVEYTTNNLSYTPGAAVYDMIVERGKDGCFVTSYIQTNTTEIIKNIAILDSNLDVNTTGGYVYKIFRNIMNCKKGN